MHPQASRPSAISRRVPRVPAQARMKRDASPESNGNQAFTHTSFYGHGQSICLKMQGHGVCTSLGQLFLTPKKEEERDAKTGDLCTPACRGHVDCPRRLPGSIRVDEACAQDDAGWDRAPGRPAFPNPDHESGDHLAAPQSGPARPTPGGSL